MQSHNPMLDTYRQLTAEVVALGDAHLPDPPPPAIGYYVSVLDEPDKRPAAVQRAARLWHPVPGHLRDIDAALTTLGESIFKIATRGDGRLTEQAKSDDIAAAAAATRVVIDASVSAVQGASEDILRRLREAAYPARPQPTDTTQEARLAGIKADLRMVWDVTPVEGDRLLDAMVDSLSRALGEGEELATWLIASTHWPEDYLQSRGIVRDEAKAWPPRVAGVLDGVSPPDLADARRIYRALSDGRRGLPMLDVLFNQLDSIVADVANWRPSAWSPIPPTLVG